MVTKHTLIKFGFVKDENNLKLKEALKNNVKLKEVHIDIYPENPLISPTSFMLLLRATEKDITIYNDNNRLILKKYDKNKTHIINVLFSKITESFLKISDGYFEFILNIQNIWYKITILN